MRNAHRASIAWVWIGLMWFPLLLAIPMLAQDVTNPLNVGFPTNGMFSGSDFDNVQLNNGNLHIEIPLWSDKGRGLGVSFKYVYDNKAWGFRETCDKQGICSDSVIGNRGTLRLVGPFAYSAVGSRVLQQCISGITVITWTGYVLSEGNGTRHHFVPDITTPGGNSCWPATGTTLHADDGSGWVLHPDSTGVVQSIVRKDGTVINPQYNPNNQWTLPGISIEDTNGNQLFLPGSNGPIVTSATDTLGRSFNLDGSYYDSSGTLRSLQITNQNVTYQTSLCGFSSADRCSEASGTVSIPQIFTLPNGMTYTFTYDQGSPTHPYYLEPLSVTLPTGGTISWGWGAPQDESGRVAISRQLPGDPNPYSYTSCQGKNLPGATSTGKVTDPAGNDTVMTCSYFLPPYPPRLTDFGIAYITKQQYYQGSSTTGQLLKSVQTDYITSGAVLPVHETTTWNQQNLVSRVETDYDSYPAWASNSISSQNPTERREFAFGSGTWGSQVRTTDYSYLHLTNSTYRSANIVDLPTSKVVHSGSSSGAIAAQTKYTYDGVTTTSTSGTPAPNHDYTGFSTSNNTRGNLTQASQGLLVGSTWTWLNTNNTYDDLGNKLSTTDPKTNKTQFSYADSWADTNCGVGSNTFAYLTTATDALQDQTKHSYFTCMGLLASTKDQNDINNSRSGTTFTYDLMNRPKITTLPDGGQTTNIYVDTVPLKVTQQKLVTTGLNIQHAMQFDGLGRPQQSQFNDPDCGGGTGLVKVDHAYGFTSGAGRFAQVSTPYCNSPDATHGLMTTTNYDALDRVTSVVQTESSTISTTYSGTSAGLTSTVTDEVGNARTSQTDALGRMTAVWEDPSGLNYETDYAYDTLDNLTKVTQMGGAASSSWRIRTFTYDSLSRLKCAANPEVTSSVNTPGSCPASDTGAYTPGTTGYSYDADGNVQTKTAPAPNQTATSSTVATTYSYDALNRLTQKSYAGGPSTATVKYGYDGVALSGCTTTPPTLSPVDANPISYRTAMCDGSGASAWAHDALGRVLTEQRIINGTSAINKNTKYTYYKDGELNKLNYPGSGRLITYTANSSSGGFSAGRPVGAIAGDGTSYVSGATYAPHGAPSALTFGGTVNGAFSYNKRLQPVQAFYGTNAPGVLTGVSCPTTIGNIMHRAYDFHVGAGDNGNVFTIRNCVNTSRTQNFTYDSLNRIATAATQGASCSACWGQMFGHMSGTTFVPGIDAWGNLHEITATQGSPTTLTQSVSNNNQFVGMTYDAAGNLTNDGQGHTYTYDAENRLTAIPGYSYVYDGDGKRVKKCSNSGCTSGTLYWTGMGSDPLAESGVGGSNTEEYVFFNDKRIARRDVSNLAVHYYFSDHLGSASVITDNLGTMPPQKEADYYPYGGEVLVSGSDINNYKFTGKERDSESGLDNFGARYNTSSLGRFMTPDSSPDRIAMRDPQSWNLYSYVRNRPTGSVEVGGKWDTGIHAQIVTYALQDYVSAGELKQLVAAQYAIDKYNASEDQAMHSMSNGKKHQSATEASAEIGQFIDSMMTEARANLGAGGSETPLSLVFEGYGIHTVEDSTSPMHISLSGLPLPWNGIGFLGLRGLAHWSGENQPDADWAAIGQAIRLTMAFHLVLGAGCEKGKTCLTKENFEKEAAKNILEYVNQWYLSGTDIDRNSEIQADAARQCALGNPAACDH